MEQREDIICISVDKKSRHRNDSYRDDVNPDKMDVSRGVMISKLDGQTIVIDFDSYWVPHTYGFVRQPS